MAVSRTFSGFVIYLYFTDSAFSTVKGMQRSKLGMKKGSFFQRKIYGYIKAEVLSDQFASVFTEELNLLIYINIPSKGPFMIVDIPPLKFEVSGITRLLRNINAKNACGPDNISLAGF